MLEGNLSFNLKTISPKEHIMPYEETLVTFAYCFFWIGIGFSLSLSNFIKYKKEKRNEKAMF